MREISPKVNFQSIKEVKSIMRIRQAKKIMKNIRIHGWMNLVYSSEQIDKANDKCLKHHARVDPAFKKWVAIVEADPMTALKLIQENFM